MRIDFYRNRVKRHIATSNFCKFFFFLGGGIMRLNIEPDIINTSMRIIKHTSD